MISFISSSRFALSSGANVDSPVIFPPGLARLATNPLPTGSVSCAMMIGIVEVASFTGRVTAPPPVMMISTLSCTSSAASAGRPSIFPSAERHSMRMSFPSTYPSSRSPWRNASRRLVKAGRGAAVRYAILGIFLGCCAEAEWESAKSTAQRIRTLIFLVMRFSAPFTRPSTLDTRPFSLDHLVRSCQHIRWNRQANLLSGIQIDDELELGWLLHREIGGLPAL